MKRRDTLLAGLSLALPLAGKAQAPASAWPDRPVNVIVAFPAGGPTDTAGRALAQGMAQVTGQPFVVDNRPGATGSIGAGMVKRMAPDGYNLLVSSLGTFVILPHLVKTLPYDPLKDFDYISIPVQVANVLVVGPSQPQVRNVADVVALLKSKPNKITFASSGNGASDHLSAELLWQQTGTQGLHVPYKGGAPAMTDLLGGQVDFFLTNINAVMQQVRASKLRALAVTDVKRSPVLPEVPTFAEAGVSGMNVHSWQGMAAPRGLPPPLKKRIGEVAVQAMQDPAIRKRLEDQGLEILANTPEEFTAFQTAEFVRWKKFIEDRKISLD